MKFAEKFIYPRVLVTINDRGQKGIYQNIRIEIKENKKYGK